MSDGERSNIDLTASSPSTPLPAPITVSNRSLRPRRQRERASTEERARSSAASSSRSSSRSESGGPQLLYPEDPDSPGRLADSSASSPGRIFPLAQAATGVAGSSRTIWEGISKSVAGEAGGDCGSRTGTKRRHSPSPIASSSISGKRKGKRRALEATGTYRTHHPSELL